MPIVLARLHGPAEQKFQQPMDQPLAIVCRHPALHEHFLDERRGGPCGLGVRRTVVDFDDVAARAGFPFRIYGALDGPLQRSHQDVSQFRAHPARRANKPCAELLYYGIGFCSVHLELHATDQHDE
jgi:hypothetical protein